MEEERLGQELSDQDRVLLVFGYLGPLALVALVASRREFVKWHAKQGLALSLAWVVIYIVMRWLQLLFGSSSAFWQPVAAAFWAMSWLVVLGVLIAGLICVIRGLEGERFKIPFLGAVADWL